MNKHDGTIFIPSSRTFSDENDSIATPEEIQEYLNSNIDYYSQEIATENKKESLTIADMNKPIGELTQEQIDKIWNATKGICGG